MYDSYPTPAVVVELNILEKNIRHMIHNNAIHNIAHRPHIKSHRSSELAKLQIANGAKGITCAKLGEAEVMCAAGIDDILIAYPIIGEDKLSRYAELHNRCKLLRSIVNSVEGAEGLSKEGIKVGKRFEVLLELDGGTGRGGLTPGEPALHFYESIREFKGIEVVGLLYYPGAIYGEHTDEGIERVARKEREELISTWVLLNEKGASIHILSGGNTVSSKVPQCLAGITEVRAGNYIFNDCAQLNFQRITEDDCALRVVSTVICRPNDHTVIIDAGTKALSSDAFPSSLNNFGRIMNHPELTLYSLNEEHGFIKSEGTMPLRIGDKVAIIPNHACVVTNLVDQIYGLREGILEHMIKIDARGMSV